MTSEKGSVHSLLITVVAVLIIAALVFVSWQNIFTAGANTDVSTWKTYESEKIPITFKYPSNWKEVQQDRANYVRLFGGSTDTVKGYSLGIFYGQNMATQTPELASCAANKEDVKSCEPYQTDTMSGIITAPKIGPDYEFRSTVGTDIYSFSANNGYMDENTFKELLKTVRLK